MPDAPLDVEVQTIPEPSWKYCNPRPHGANQTARTELERDDAGPQKRPSRPHTYSDDASECLEHIAITANFTRTLTCTEASTPIDLSKLLLQTAVEMFVGGVSSDLRNDRIDAREEGTSGPSQSAEACCIQLALRLAAHLALAPALKWAAFTEEDGKISLVVQSLVTDRRLNYTISADGSLLSALGIDESMRTRRFPVSLNDDLAVELAQWVRRRT